MKTCDNTSVGIIITNPAGEYLMFDRNTFPPGTAPAAGHIDSHGTAQDAAVAEVNEELGLHVVSLALVGGWWRPNRCRRLPGAWGTGHQWTIYEATVTGELAPSARETKNVRWVPAADLQDLADRTAAYARGLIGDAAFAERPGIEPVWVQWLANAGVVDVAAADLLRIDTLAAAAVPAPGGAL